MTKENILYLILYIPLLVSILSNFFNKYANDIFSYFTLTSMILLSTYLMIMGKINISHDGLFYLFDNNLYSNVLNLLILNLFLLLKIFLKVKYQKLNKNMYYPLYFIGIFSFTVACINSNIINSITFFIIYLFSEYELKNS